MALKQKKSYHQGKHDEKHTKRFVKAYAPYLPLLLIVGFGLFISTTSTFKNIHGNVLSYATNMTDSGLLSATNKERAKSGLGELSYNPVLDKAAQSKAEDMAKRNYWSHNTPDGKEPWVFFDSVEYKYLKAAENLAYGFDTSDAAVVGWMNSPSHRANVLDGDLKEVGFGIINVENYQNKGPETIVVAMYGTPVHSTLAQTAPAAEGTGSSPITTVASTNSPEEAKRITYAQMLTGGSAPWISFAIGIGIGLLIMYLVLKHARKLHRSLRKGEKFVLHHPVLDMTIIALIALATIVAQTAGVIH